MIRIRIQKLSKEKQYIKNLTNWLNNERKMYSIAVYCFDIHIFTFEIGNDDNFTESMVLILQ